MRIKKVILLVNNDEQGLSVLSFMLATNSFHVLSATSAHEAVNIFKRSVVDLVIANFEMTAIGGVELAGILKQLDSFVPIILLGEPMKMHGILSLADAHLNKRISAAELLEWAKSKTKRKRGPKKGAQRRQPPVPSHLAAQNI